jgi:hypothetical protein
MLPSDPSSRVIFRFREPSRTDSSRILSERLALATRVGGLNEKQDYCMGSGIVRYRSSPFRYSPGGTETASPDY